MRGLQVLVLGALLALVMASAPILTQAAPEVGGWEPLVESYNGTGQRLFRGFAENPGNIVLSPFSIGTAMAMALVGARGETQAEMANVLALPLPREEIDAASAAVLASLNASSSGSFALRAANALMLTRQGGAVSGEYVAALKKYFGADEFRGDDVAVVNAWVRKRTDGKIDSILDRLDPMTALVLIDAIYFKAPWQTAFAPKRTRYEAFHLLSGDAKVPMMHVHADFPVAHRRDYRAIRLPYAGGRISMVIILPEAGTDELVSRLDGGEMHRLLAGLHMPEREVELALPRFKAGFAADLAAPFKAMGMHRAFDLATADFSGMTGKPQSLAPLAIGQIKHRAVIEVTEQGTEAAAATGMGEVTTAVRPVPEIFRVDRPFVFAIVDDQTSAILFEGRIADPRQTS